MEILLSRLVFLVFRLLDSFFGRSDPLCLLSEFVFIFFYECLDLVVIESPVTA